MSEGKQIQVSQRLPISRYAAWEWLTHSDKMAKWYGPYRMDGDRLIIKLIHEEGQPEAEARLLDFVTESLVKLRLNPADDRPWDVSFRLTDEEGGSRVTISQASVSREEDPWVAAGWAFYLGCLLAAIEKRPAPPFSDYTAGLGDPPSK